MSYPEEGKEKNLITEVESSTFLLLDCRIYDHRCHKRKNHKLRFIKLKRIVTLMRYLKLILQEVIILQKNVFKLWFSLLFSQYFN